MKDGINKSARLTKIIDLLNRTSPTGGLTIDDFTRELGVTDRTIYRDLFIIEFDLKMDLLRPEKSSGRKGKYRLLSTYLPSLSPEKALFIYLSLLQQKGTALDVRIEEIKQAIVATLTKNRYSLKDVPLDKLESRIYIVEQRLSEPENVCKNFLLILDALDKSFAIKMKYFVAYRQELTERIIEPYGIICKNYNWYLTGNCLDKGIRTFRIDQIEQVLPRKEQKFTYPQDFSLEEYCKNSWGVFREAEVKEILVKFNPTVAYRIKRIIYHPSQEIIEELTDGSVIVKFNITGTIEFIGWLLQWNKNAEVLEPIEVRNQVKKAIEDMLGVYS